MVSYSEFASNYMIDLYIRHFPEHNSTVKKEWNETPKWDELIRFRDHWNLDAEDMGTMLKESISTEFLESTYQSPLQGLVRLVQHPGEDEFLRAAFENLFTDDQENLDERQRRIHIFVDAVNTRIDAYDPGTSIYRQDKADAIFYLSLYDNSGNYRFKPAAANEWAKLVGGGDSFSGKHFSLARYYQMCDELREVIAKHEELLAIHGTRFDGTRFGTPKEDLDSLFHLLTFDVIYCTWNEKVALEDVKLKYKQVLFEEKQKELAELTSSIQEVDIRGNRVHHKKFGDGEVTTVTDGKMIVRFAKEEKSFLYPTAFLNGFLKCTDVDVLTIFQKNDEVYRKINKLKSEIEALKTEIEGMMQ